MATRRFIIKLLLLVAICLSGGSVFSFYTLLYEQNDKTEPTMVIVEKGDSLGAIAHQFKKDGLIKNISVMKAAARLAGKSTQIKAGEYRIPPRASTKLILDILIKGQTVVRRVTIPEGKTSYQIFDLLMQTPGLVGELTEVPQNGTLLPETYTFAYGTPRTIIVKRMQDGMKKTIDELWPYRDPDLPYTTKDEAMTLASIVEKETSVPEERARIAAVFVNRLRTGMRLQTDPTVIFALTDGRMDLNRRLTHADLRHQHEYNTYVKKGLPPGPICNPGRDSILAVLQPIQSDEFYFVADGSGGHVFSKNFDQHRRNIAAAKKARRQRILAARRRKGKTTAVAVQKKPRAENVISTATTIVSPEENSTTITTTFAEDSSGNLLDASEISEDILDDTLLEDAAEKPADPEKSKKATTTKPAQSKKATPPAKKPITAKPGTAAKATGTKKPNTAAQKNKTSSKTTAPTKKAAAASQKKAPAKKTAPQKKAEPVVPPKS